MLTQTRQRVDKPALDAARTVRLLPTSVAAGYAPLAPEQLHLIRNTVDRSLCANLSDRFNVVGVREPADLVVHAVVTHVDPTDVTAATASSVINIGGTVAGAVTGLPIPSARLPVGLGSLSVEAEATDSQHRQVAAMTWARGADSLTVSARASEEGDAYALGKEFAADFSRLLASGADPIKDLTPSLPTSQRVSEYFGGKPKYEFCERFGSDPGLTGTVAGALGLPPAWTDAGEKNRN